MGKKVLENSAGVDWTKCRMYT